MLLRLDKEIVKRALVATRSRAQFLIREGAILVNNKIVRKASYKVSERDNLKLARNAIPWVSRSGLKLDHAVKLFELAPLDGVALDIGASTGGFTEVLLFYGCKKVYAIDVGRDQLHESLKKDTRVVSIEKMNAKNLDRVELPFFDYIVCDVSFISIQKFLKNALKYAKRTAKLILLVKPQFEVGRYAVGKNGIVNNTKYHDQACESTKDFLIELGWEVKNLEKSPIKGADGNIEFLIFATK